jgi:hypothetical protein
VTRVAASWRRGTVPDLSLYEYLRLLLLFTQRSSSGALTAQRRKTRQPPCGWCSSSSMNVLPSAGIGFAFRMRAMCTTLCAIQRVVRFV